MIRANTAAGGGGGRKHKMESSIQSWLTTMEHNLCSATYVGLEVVSFTDLQSLCVPNTESLGMRLD